MQFFALLTLAACAFAQNNIRVEFEDLTAGSAPPSPYERLQYSSQFSVLAQNRTTALKVPTPPHVLSSPNLAPGTVAGVMTKIDADRVWTLKGFSWACVQNNGSALVPVGCSVSIFGVRPTTCGSSSVERTVDFAGKRPFQRSKILLNHLINATWTVTSINTTTETPVTLLIDNLNYATIGNSARFSALAC